MTESDEHLLTAAKLMERKRGDLDGHVDVYDHAGEVIDGSDAATLSFVESCLSETDDLDENRFEETALGSQVTAKFRAGATAQALEDGNSTLLSHLVGVTEKELQADSLSLHARLSGLIENNEAPAFILGAGNPETGKTNLMLLLAKLRSYSFDEYLVISNTDCSMTDVRVTSAHDLAVALLEHRDVQKFVFVDEASTHFDARTYSHQVATQWTPLAKRFAKLNVDAAGAVGHTGKDLHPEAKRLATLCFWKLEKDVVEFFEGWPSDADRPEDQLFGGPLEDLEPANVEYSPDDSAPWAWDLEPELFARDLDWDELLTTLKERGPAE
jgi:hypothetical protein